MIPGSFIVNGIESGELNSYIQNRPEIKTPRRKVNFREVSGRSGAVPFDEKAYENTELTLNIFTSGHSEEEISNKKDKIIYAFDGGSYFDFIPYFDPDMIYRVMTVDGPNFTGKGTHKNFLPYNVGLTVKPFKYFRKNNNKMELTNGATLVNPSFYESEPIITIFGSGDISININGRIFNMKNVQETIIIDSKIAHAYKNNNGNIVGQDNKTYTLDFPILDKGQNLITWSGNVTKFEIEPRWKTLV